MSREATELLDAFDALPEEERRVIAAELFRRALPFDSGPLEDEETAQAADELFRCLEAEEAESNDTSAR